MIRFFRRVLTKKNGLGTEEEPGKRMEAAGPPLVPHPTPTVSPTLVFPTVGNNNSNTPTPTAAQHQGKRPSLLMGESFKTAALAAPAADTSPAAHLRVSPLLNRRQLPTGTRSLKEINVTKDTATVVPGQVHRSPERRRRSQGPGSLVGSSVEVYHAHIGAQAAAGAASVSPHATPLVQAPGGLSNGKNCNTGNARTPESLSMVNEEGALGPAAAAKPPVAPQATTPPSALKAFTASFRRRPVPADTSDDENLEVKPREPSMSDPPKPASRTPVEAIGDAPRIRPYRTSNVGSSASNAAAAAAASSRAGRQGRNSQITSSIFTASSRGAQATGLGILLPGILPAEGDSPTDRRRGLPAPAPHRGLHTSPSAPAGDISAALAPKGGARRPSDGLAPGGAAAAAASLWTDAGAAVSWRTADPRQAALEVQQSMRRAAVLSGGMSMRRMDVLPSMGAVAGGRGDSGEGTVG